MGDNLCHTGIASLMYRLDYALGEGQASPEIVSGDQKEFRVFFVLNWTFFRKTPASLHRYHREERDDFAQASGRYSAVL